jgi:hypothetical protein
MEKDESHEELNFTSEKRDIACHDLASASTADDKVNVKML